MSSEQIVGVRIRLLGPVGATVDGREVEIGGPKERAVLALLAANPAIATSTERLIDAIWDDRPPKSAKKTVQTYVSHLRKALDATDTPQVIVTGPGGYGLSSAVTTDVEEVDALMASASRTEGRGADCRVTVLTEALARFVGPPLSATAPSAALDALGEAYDQLRWNLIEELAEARLADGVDPSLAVDLHSWVDENPYRERLWGHLMTALYRAGRQADALAAFQRARGHLADGLGIEPGPELRELESRILLQDPTLSHHGGRLRPTIGSSSETLTFLFTDIEQSTVRWELEPDSMRRALELHDELLTSLIASAGGRVFAAAGDGFGAAFANPSSAANVAVTLQHRLRALDWPTSQPLLVRMGLHTGSAENRGGDYFGPPVNRAARVMDAAHGGQILCSAATAALLGDDPDLAGRIRFVAECRLKGLARPERLHQLAGSDRDDEFPPPRSSPGPRRVVPTPLDSLHGRDAELAELVDILAGQRLVTLTGVGGTGKTRLALELAHRVGEAYPDGVIWLELAAVDPDGVVGAAARAIGVTLTGTGEGHRSQVAAALREENALLVLDNCEHLLGVAAANVEAILQNCPGVSILTTSREPLGVAGERIYVVPSLGLPGPEGMSASEALLRARATSAGASVADDDATAAAVRDICVRVDGVPLALEFAAAQLTTYPAPQLVRHLEDHFRLLGRPGRGGVPRQQTIDSTIEWSYQLLDESERRMLDRLAVFHGGFDLDAAGPVAGFDLEPGESTAVLERLRWKSLVTVTTEPGASATRFKLLEPVRQFAHARLRLSGEHEAVLDRHADHFASVAPRPTDGDRFAHEEPRSKALLRDRANHQLALSTLSRRDDITAALKLVDTHRIVFTVEWDFATDTLREIGPLLSAPDVDVDPVVLGHVCNTFAMIDGWNFRPSALDWANRALALAQQTGNETLLAESQFHLGAIWVGTGDGAAGERHLRRSCELHERLGNWGTLSYNLCWLAWSLVRQGHLEDAVEPARRGVSLTWEHAASPDTSAIIAAIVLAATGHDDEAATILERAHGTYHPGSSSYAAVAALMIERMDLAIAEAPALLQRNLGRNGSHDITVTAMVAVLCHRLGEHDLSAVWAAATVGQERRLVTHDTIVAGAGDRGLRRNLASMLEIDAAVTAGRARLGDRFDELVRHHETSDDPGPVRDTITVLEGHASRLSGAEA